MPLSATEFVALARRGLGDRDTIADETSLNSAVVYALNRTVRRAANRFDWANLERLYSSVITTADYVFSLPSATDDSTISSVKSILAAWLEIDNSGYDLKYIAQRRRDDVFVHTDESNNTGQPRYIGRFDENNFWVHPFPDKAYTIHMRVLAYPAEMTINSASQPLGVGLDHVVAAGVQAELFRELQEPDDARAWEDAFERFMREEISAQNDKPDWHPGDRPSRVYASGRPADYTTNPWYHGRLGR